MELWALEILPWSLLIFSLLVAGSYRWSALGILASVNVIRCTVYLSGWYWWNPALSELSAILMLIAAEESMLKCMRPWPTVFCAGIGVMLAALAVQIGEASDPLRSGLHVATATMLGVAVFVSLLNRCDHLAIARQCLLVVYVVGAIFASKQSVSDLWWTILTTEAVHVAALSGLLWLALRARLSIPVEREP